MNEYRAGYVSATQGNAIIEGFGTRFLSHCHAGDSLTLAGDTVTIASVDDNHLLTLSAPWPGQTVSRARYSIALSPVAESLADARKKAEALVDRLAGTIRLKYITSAPGQDVIYMAKLDDAKAYVAAGYPADSAPYPWIHAEAAAVNVSAQVAADFIIQTAAQWVAVGAQIEGARQAAKRAVGVAVDRAAIEQAVDGFKLATAGL